MCTLLGPFSGGGADALAGALKPTVGIFLSYSAAISLMWILEPFKDRVCGTVATIFESPRPPATHRARCHLLRRHAVQVSVSTGLPYAALIVPQRADRQFRLAPQASADLLAFKAQRLNDQVGIFDQ